MSAIVHHIKTMSSIELVSIINDMREEGRAELRHDTFMAKVEKHPGITHQNFLASYKDSTGRKLKCYQLPRRECELMIMSESLEVQTKVYDRLAELEVLAAPVRRPRVTADPALSAFRQARAIEIASKTASSICDRFPNLGQASQQVIFAKLINPAAGADVVPLPILENKTLSAGEVGAILNISGNAVGRIANTHSLKTPEFGAYVLDKSASSAKQVESFRYNAAGVRSVKSDRFVFTGDEMRVMNEALEIHDLQLAASRAIDIDRAAAEVYRRLQHRIDSTSVMAAIREQEEVCA